MFYDLRYMMFMAPAIILMLIVQWYVKSAYNTWSRVPARSRLSGAQAAQRLMQSGALYGVRIEGIQGNLTDHYDPRKSITPFARCLSGFIGGGFGYCCP